MINVTIILPNWKAIFCLPILVFAGQTVFSQTTVNFNFTNSIQTFVVPPCVFSLNITAAGAKGGGGNGGNGAVITGIIPVTPGQILEISVGGMGACPGTGFNGGGNGPAANSIANAACGGGGATDIRITPYALGNRLIVAGGGGGMGGGDQDGAGGIAGCPNGTTGAAPFGLGGSGAFTTAGGTGGPPWIPSGFFGTNGTFGQGGSGGSDPCFNVAPGGGGGGGLYGGGGGGSDCFGPPIVGGGGGGGGSSLIPAGGGCASGANGSNGYLTITYSLGFGTTDASSTGPYCVGDLIQLNGQPGADTYSWTGPNGFVSTDQNPTIPNATLLNAGVYTLTATTSGCAANDDVTVVVNPNPVFSIITSANPSSCALNDGTITLGGLDPNVSYSVSHTGGSSVIISSDGAGNIVISGLGAGNYTDFVVGLNGCDSQNNSLIQLVEPNGPAVAAGADLTICVGDEITLTAGNPDGAIISWNNGVNDGVPFTPPIGSTIYTVTGDLLNCLGTDALTVNVNPLPTIDAGPDITVCEGSQTSLIAGNPDGASISWNNGVVDGAPFTPPITGETYTVTAELNGCFSTDEVLVSIALNPSFTLSSINPSGCNITDGSISLNGLIPGETYNVSHSGGTTASLVADANGVILISGLGSGSYSSFDVELNNCSTLDSMTIVLSDPNLPPVNAGNDQSICAGDEITLTADNPNGASISWNNGVNDGVSFTPPMGSTIYIVTAIGSLGCESNDQVQIIVNDLPTVDAGIDTVICDGTEIILSGSGNAATYTWNNSVTDGIGFNPSVGTTTFTVTGISVDQCINTDQITVIVNPLPIINAGFDESICTGEDITLTGSGNADTYSWSNGVLDGVAFLPQTTTTYTLTGIGANGCSATDAVTVTLNPLPTVIAGDDIIICVGEQVILSGSGTATTYTWDNGVLDGGLFTPGVGTITYTVIGTDANGCSNTASVSITVVSQPVAAFTATPQTGMPPLDVSLNNNSSNGTTYSWYFGNGDQDISNSPDDFNIIYSETGTYTVLLVVDNGVCSNDTSLTINVENLPLVFNLPNIFTPNSDSSNDIFHLGLQNAARVNVEIFNRWGNQVGLINSVDPLQGWNGLHMNSGKAVSDGVYFYKYEIEDLNGEILSGHQFVHLKR